MDIITHGLSGIAVGTVIASFAAKGFKPKAVIILLSGFAAILPDFDAISLWSKFDDSIGKILQLRHTGKEIYFSKLWYAHHAFLHSVVAGLILTLLLFLIRFFAFAKSYTFSDLSKFFKADKILLLSFFSAFLMHLIEDMPTPACVWGGVAFLWPAKEYWGGTGDIWWWNNYDIFLIIVLVITLNLLILTCSRWLKKRTGKIALSIFAIGFICCFIQIKTRGFDFNYTGHQVDFEAYEAKSLQIQRELLGEKVYGWMRKFDRKVKVNF